MEHIANNSDEKTSVKVHAPPGGKSNFSFGFDEQPASYQPTLKQKDLNKKGFNQGYGYGGMNSYE